MDDKDGCTYGQNTFRPTGRTYAFTTVDLGTCSHSDFWLRLRLRTKEEEKNTSEL